MTKSRAWSAVSTAQASLTAAGALVLFHFLSTKGWMPILDGANLMFHEAGHALFGILGETMHWLGGTLGQLAFPLIVSVIFWTRRDTLGFAIGQIWFFQNFINIARYMADARTQLLPLVGGGEHDWAYLFGSWQVIHLDTKIAGVVGFIGWVGMWGSLTWLIWRWWTSTDNREAD